MYFVKLRFYCKEVILCLLTEAKPKDETPNFPSTRDYYKDDQSCYIMDAKSMGNIGRYLNVSSKNTKKLIICGGTFKYGKRDIS